ncbi:MULTISPECIES: lipopolysaccharide kinase InaA family protein [unclassified Thioalkalivibrio]|uniref:lipopolysaccharide kinase InaA family protein n=1 Tax=unclassified Thioalkalivibrio TaxID=2621013 RepID=UPI00039FBC4C|nr:MULTISPECIES: serine/threonine-protein kinase [unclassified Thioalkalivibrio]
MSWLMQWLAGIGRGSSVKGVAPLDEDLKNAGLTLLENQPKAGWTVLDSSAQARVARGQWQSQAVVIKIFLPRGPWESVKSIGRGSRGMRAIRHGRQMSEDGFDTPRALAYGWIGVNECLVMEDINGASLSHLITSRHGEPFLAIADRHLVHRRLAETVAHLHESGWTHGDLRLGNILVSPPSATGRLVFLDNERSKKHGRPCDGQKNLVQLNMTHPSFLPRTSRVRFLSHYATQRGMGRVAFRHLAIRIAQATEARHQERLRRGGSKARFSAK